MASKSGTKKRGLKTALYHPAPGVALGERRASKVPPELVYFTNLEWNGQTLRELPKVIPARDFSSYENYIAFLGSSLQRLAENMLSPDRTFAYDWQGSLSRGYDSSRFDRFVPLNGGGAALVSSSDGRK